MRAVDHPEPVDLLDTAGAPVVRRIARVLAVVAAVWLVRVLPRRGRD